MNLTSLSDVRLMAEMQSPEAVDEKQYAGKSLEEVAQEFEAVFIKQMLDALDRTVNREGNILYGGHAEDMYRGALNQEMSLSLAENKGIGIKDMILEQLGRVHYGK